jgi:3-methyladenine DNA glycosylase Tag
VLRYPTVGGFFRSSRYWAVKDTTTEAADEINQSTVHALSKTSTKMSSAITEQTFIVSGRTARDRPARACKRRLVSPAAAPRRRVF